jgi:hypothetical protein
MSPEDTRDAIIRGLAHAVLALIGVGLATQKKEDDN